MRRARIGKDHRWGTSGIGKLRLSFHTSWRVRNQLFISRKYYFFNVLCSSLRIFVSSNFGIDGFFGFSCFLNLVPLYFKLSNFRIVKFANFRIFEIANPQFVDFLIFAFLNSSNFRISQFVKLLNYRIFEFHNSLNFLIFEFLNCRIFFRFRILNSSNFLIFQFLNSYL